MEVKFTARAASHYHWMQHHAPKLHAKIDSLIDEIIENPYRGIGKPEALKHEFAGWWSRRINDEHRLVYRIDGDRILIYQCRFHYDKK